jgi:hypothetical protein
MLEIDPRKNLNIKKKIKTTKNSLTMTLHSSSRLTFKPPDLNFYLDWVSN